METIERIWNWCETHWRIVAIACLIALILIGPIEQKGRNEKNRQPKLRSRQIHEGNFRNGNPRNVGGRKMSKIKVAFWDEIMAQQEAEPKPKEENDGEK